MPVLALLFVLMGGLTLNNVNASRPMQNADDLKHALEKTLEDAAAQDHFVSFKLNN